MIDRLFEPLLRRMLHPPHRPARPLPTQLAARATDVTIKGDTLPIKGWLLRPDGEASGSVVFVHGWGSDAGRMGKLAAPVLARGLAVLLVDLPGHGRTGPVDSYNGKLMVDDLRTVRSWMDDHLELTPPPAAIVGYSFGGLGAYVAASQDARWAALAVLAAPRGPMEATRLYLDGKGLPGRWLTGFVKRAFQRMVGLDPDSFDAHRTLPSIRVPVLVVHGEQDEVVPVGHGAAVAAAVPPGLGTFVRVPGADHGALMDDTQVAAQLAEFIAAALERAGERR